MEEQDEGSIGRCLNLSLLGPVPPYRRRTQDCRAKMHFRGEHLDVSQRPPQPTSFGANKKVLTG